jgi:hypothetical protein
MYNKIMEILGNWGIEFLCWLNERTSVGNTEFFSSFCLHSVVLMSVN